MRTEVETHAWFSHPRVPMLFEVVNDGEGLNLVFEYGGEPVYHFVKTGGDLEAVRRNTSLAVGAAETMLTVLDDLHARVGGGWTAGG